MNNNDRKHIGRLDSKMFATGSFIERNCGIIV